MGLKTNQDVKDAYALIVGISTYKDAKIPKLNYTTHDAQAIFDLLVNPDMAGFKKENIKFFLDDEATLFNIKDAISNWLFKNAKEDSMVFIFFAGHGGVEEDRLGIEKDNLAKYLLPYDADFDNFFASALSNSDFNRLLLSIKSKRLVVFMDSCYSGGVSEKKARDVKIVEDPYEKMAEGEGRLVIAASQPDQRSFEDENLSHGIFTYHLIDALKGKADLDNDGYVTAMEVYKYLSETVTKTARRLAGGVQEPILRGDLKTDFVLTVSRKRLEEIKHADIKKRNLKRLSDWYHDEKLGAAQYELACRLIESSIEDLSGDDKKVLKSLKDLLSDKISISTFQHDVGIIKGLEELPSGKPEGEGERIKGEEETKSFYEKMSFYLNATQDAFVNQCKIRNRLVKILGKKHDIKKYETYDKLFAELYPTMNEEERHLFQFIRGITENTLFKYNSLIVQLLNVYPHFYNDLPELRQLHDHLNLWLDKYNSIFRNKENMCLVYVGVEEKNPFPKEIDEIIKAKIDKLRKMQKHSSEPNGRLLIPWLKKQNKRK